MWAPFATLMTLTRFRLPFFSSCALGLKKNPWTNEKELVEKGLSRGKFTAALLQGIQHEDGAKGALRSRAKATGTAC